MFLFSMLRWNNVLKKKKNLLIVTRFSFENFTMVTHTLFTGIITNKHTLKQASELHLI